MKSYHLIEDVINHFLLLGVVESIAAIFKALGLLAFSTLLPSHSENAVRTPSCSSQLQVTMFFISLYLVAFAQGSHKPCAQAFGDNQFDADSPKELKAERKAKSFFFNWWYIGLNVGPAVEILVLSYIQDNFSCGLGFWIPCIVMGFFHIIFMLGTRTYRFGEKTKDISAFVRISRVFIKVGQNWRITPLAISTEEEACETLPHQNSKLFKFLNKALFSSDGSDEDGTVCNIDEVEEAKSLLRLVPIWASCLAYTIVCSTYHLIYQTRSDHGSSFDIQAATLQSFISICVMILIPIYDSVLVQVTISITKRPSGITMPQRIGTGIFISIISMIVAALIETKRLKTAREYGILDDPNAIVPMKIWWLLPRYLLAGARDVFAVVGMQEFLYDQMLSDLKSIGLALYLNVMGIESFLSSFIILIVQKMTGGKG